MSKRVDKIYSLIKNLPNKDINLGYKFLEERDFESLKDLVDSAIYKIKSNLVTNQIKEEYLDIDLDLLTSLKAEVDVYLTQIDGVNYLEDIY